MVGENLKLSTISCKLSLNPILGVWEPHGTAWNGMSLDPVADIFLSGYVFLRFFLTLALHDIKYQDHPHGFYIHTISPVLLFFPEDHQFIRMHALRNYC